MKPPDVSYARSGDVSIAYQVVGDSGMDVVFLRAITGDLLSTWEQPLLVRHVEGLASNGRVIMLDRQGTGLSDRVREVQSLETTMDDVRAAMDAVGSERAVLWTGGPATGIAVLFAATYPERCEIRAGLHTGECEVSDGKVVGIAVSIGGAHFIARRGRGCAGLEHGQGPRGRIGTAFRGPRRPSAQGDT